MPHDAANLPDSLKLRFNSASGDWLWSLRRGVRQASGQAPSLDSALCEGAFAAAALAAFERINRRRF